MVNYVACISLLKIKKRAIHYQFVIIVNTSRIITKEYKSCVQPHPSAVKVTLLAFAAKRRHVACRARSISSARWALSSKTNRPPLLLSIDETDIRTDALPLHRPRSAVCISTMRAASISDRVDLATRSCQDRGHFWTAADSAAAAAVDVHAGSSAGEWVVDTPPPPDDDTPATTTTTQ